jgi:hypothetical protein
VNAAALLAVSALLAAPSVSPSSAPTEKPLLEIGRVRVTTPLCKTLATHAGIAANRALDGDRTVVVTARSLRSVDLDKNVILKHRGSEELRREYAALHASATQGESEMKKFREALKAETNDEQRAALEKFADALDGALHRQKKLAQDMARYIAWLDTQEPIDDVARAAQERDILFRANNFGRPKNPFGDANDIPDTLNKSAQRAADELELRELAVSKDEDTAADRIDTAFKGC